MLTRKDIEKEEYSVLAPYAAKSQKTRGRQYAEKEHDYRSVYQRDRDRIIYSTAFRRLEYKTQVFVNHEGDHYRTRLTHTLEVAQIARTIARALGLNVELVEAIALAHDLGHTPFGHSGEDVLAELMADHGGFDHNTQGLRVVDALEKIYPDFPGLNLTYEVREGIIRHSTPFDRPRPCTLETDGSSTLEAQVVDMADEIAYDNHDLDDGLASGLLEENSLKNIGLWEKAHKSVVAGHPRMRLKVRRSQTIKTLINLQVTDAIKATEKNIKANGVKSIKDVKDFPGRLVSFSRSMVAGRKPVRDFLMKNLYNHYRVARMSAKACRFMKDLFGAYIGNPEQLPASAARALRRDGKHRAVCDYIAGMTDRYALEEYKKLFDPYTRV